LTLRKALLSGPESAAFTMMSLTFVAVAAISCVTAMVIGDRGV
jgi:hypothetical protein